MNLKNILMKIVGYESYYAIAYRKKNSEEIYTILKNTKDVWCADPILYRKDNESYVFYEAFNVKERKGYIEVVCLEDKRKTRRAVIKEPYHMSFPYIHQIENKLLMIPEVSESNCINFYECVKFPEQWKLLSSIQTDKKFVDCTVYQEKSEYYLFAGELLSENTLKTKLTIFKMNIVNDNVELEKVYSQKNFDFDSRNAGPFFREEEQWYRTTQKSEFGIYGYSILFQKVEGIHDNVYSEKLEKEIKPSDIQLNANIKIEGVHTYSRDSEYEVIDIKYEKFNALKWWNRINDKIRKWEK